MTERMERKLKTKKGKAVYARRRAIVEPVCGQISTRQGKTRAATRTREGPREWELMAGCDNLLKLFNHRAQMA